MKNISTPTKGNAVHVFGAILRLISILQQRVLAFILSLCSHAIREEVEQKACIRRCFFFCAILFVNIVVVTRM